MANTKAPNAKPAKPSEASRLEREPEGRRALTALNFKLMAVAGIIIVAGFLLMLGGGSTETEFNPDIFSARRTVIGPTIAFLGFIFMGAAIMWNSKRNYTDK